MAKRKTNKQQIQELLFRLSNIVYANCTVVLFAYYTSVIIERHLNITRTPKKSNYKAPTRTTHVNGPHVNMERIDRWNLCECGPPFPARSANSGPPISRAPLTLHTSHFRVLRRKLHMVTLESQRRRC